MHFAEEIYVHAADWPVTNYLDSQYTQLFFSLSLQHNDFAYLLPLFRPIHTMKIMHNESKLIHVVCVYTECTLTAIRFEYAFSQSTSIGGLKQV